MKTITSIKKKTTNAEGRDFMCCSPMMELSRGDKVAIVLVSVWYCVLVIVSTQG